MAKILAIMEPEHAEQTAFLRCAELTPTPDLSIHLAFFVPASQQSENYEKGVPCKRKEWMEQLVAEHRKKGLKITTEVIPFQRLYESIILTALNINADFIFKPVRKHSLLQRSLFTSTDWNLVRLCPLPLLLVSESKSSSHKPVLAALDVCTSDQNHAELNRIILSQTRVVARALDSKAYAVNAYSFPTTVWGYSSSDPIPYQISRAKHEDHVREARILADEFGIAPCQLEVREGAPALVVNDYAREIDAGVIVLGTVARSGLAGLFIGNTAESVLETCGTDVMVVKQADFQSPISIT